MGIINEKQLRHLIYECVDKKILKLEKEIDKLWFYLNKYREEFYSGK